MEPRPQRPIAAIADADLQTKLGVVIRMYRNQLGISQEELAWRANMHRTYIAGVERGARNVTLRSIANLAKALQVTVGNLFSYAAEPSETTVRVAANRAQNQVREILMVEDDATDAAMAVRALKGAKVTNPMRIVRDAEDGLNYLFASGPYAKRKPMRPQLILLDLNLPRMSGLEFLRRIKADERTREIAVVVLTVSRSDRMIIACSRLGAENYIVKPVGIENLVGVTPKLNLYLTLGPPVETGNIVGAA
jgi:two-component system response regulator